MILGEDLFGYQAHFFTWNLLFTGLVGGLIIAVFAMGIVLVYRSSRIINFAVGNLGVPAVALFAIMAGKNGWPYWLAAAVALVVGTGSGTVVELTVIRRLFHAPRVIVLVATIGVAQLALAITLALPDYRTGTLRTQFPLPFAGHWQLGLGIEMSASQLFTLIVVPLIIIGLWWLLRRTAFGDSVRAAATNADLARMTGINPKLMSTGVWAIAGFLSTIAILLTATDQGSTDLVLIGPQTLLRAMAAALIGGMTSFPRAAMGAILIGIGERVVTFNYPANTGLAQFLLFLVVVVLVAGVGRKESGGESFQFAPRASAVPERLRAIWWVRHVPQLAAGGGLLVAVALPLVSTQSADQQTWSTILAFALCAVSVVVLTGWAGQLSLSQMAFGGLGALTAATIARHTTALPFPWTLLLGAALASGVAVLVGAGALRVRGLLLAMSTLAFAIAAETWVFTRPFFTGGNSTVRIPRANLGPLDLTTGNRGYYYFALVVLVVVLLLVGHLRRTGIGRTIAAVRENEHAAAAMTVSPTRAKITAFALAGFIAGLGGAILGAVNLSFGPSDRYFLAQDSVKLIAMVVIGGLGSLSGAVIGALWVIGLPAIFPDNNLVPLFSSSIGLLVILLYFPGGFAQIGYSARDRVFAWLDRRMPPSLDKTTTSPPPSLTRVEGSIATLNQEGAILATRGLTVTFGGLVAVDAVDLTARAGETIGLIGTNGAGKSTLLNAIGGFVRSTGSIQLLGTEISRKKPHARARLGLGRTFQTATLYPDMTVRDTVQLALEARRRTSFWGSLTYFPSRTSERAKQSEAAELIDYLGLSRYADRYIAELSTGTRRIVELATVLAVASRVICLDEPTAGIAQREAEAFGPLIKQVQSELHATLIIVEHDLPMVLSISDRIYCMEAGQVIAEGTPREIRDNPRVISSYLGTDERPIMRSGAQP